MTTTHMPACKCPNCGKLLDGWTDLDSDSVPGPGDFGICFSCQCIHVFTNGLGLRTPTVDELLQLPFDVVSRYQRALTAIKR